MQVQRREAIEQIGAAPCWAWKVKRCSRSITSPLGGNRRCPAADVGGLRAPRPRV